MIWKKKDNLNTMTRAHVRHSPPFSIQRSLSRRGGEMSRFLSCLILLFIIALWAPLAKCSLYINNTGSIKSRRICFCSFFVCLYVWSHLCIIQFYLWLYNNCYYNYKDNWWACMHLSSVLPSRVYEFVRKRKKKEFTIKICDHDHEKLRNQHHLLIKLFKKMFDCHVLVDH